MNASSRWRRISGRGIHGLIGAIMLLSGVAKLAGAFPAEQVEKLGLSDWIAIIGAGELATAVLLFVPRTVSLGTLLASSFWGGAICLHMSRGEPIVLQSALLLLTWVGAYLRVPAIFSSFVREPVPAQSKATVDKVFAA